MIRIAFIIDTIATPAAGTEKQLLTLMNQIDKFQFEPHLICLRSSQWLENNILPVDTKILDVGSLLSFGAIRGLFRFRRLHRTIHFDIVQTFFVDGNIFGTIAALFSGCKTTISSRRNIGYWHNRVHVAILRFLRRWTDCYLCNSKAARDLTISLERIDPTRVQIIYNGLDFEVFDSITDNNRCAQRREWLLNDDDIVVGSVTNLRPVKNIELLIYSASVLIREFPNLRFVVVGDGSLREELQSNIDSLGLKGSFVLAGHVDNIPLALSAFDIAVMPSLSESFSNSLLEYMAAKLPIVSSDSGGNSEALVHQQTGLLFSLDDKDGLLNGIRELVLDQAKAAQLAESAYFEARRKYDISLMTRYHQVYYNKIVER